MQFKIFSVLFFACMTAVVSAAPVPVEIPPLDVEAREIFSREHLVPEVQVAREAAPEPICGKWACM